MRRICCSKAWCELPKATNIRPACMLIIHGMERRSMKAGGSKLSCAVRLTWAEVGESSSSSLSLRRRPMW
jgi:hypothetical protein